MGIQSPSFNYGTKKLPRAPEVWHLGAVKMDAGFVAAREVAYKQEGEWIVGLNRYLGLYLVFDVEL
ncbi:hypothetical protein Gotur_001982 [Gossypium turneri]